MTNPVRERSAYLSGQGPGPGASQPEAPPASTRRNGRRQVAPADTSHPGTVPSALSSAPPQPQPTEATPTTAVRARRVRKADKQEVDEDAPATGKRPRRQAAERRAPDDSSASASESEPEAPKKPAPASRPKRRDRKSQDPDFELDRWPTEARVDSKKARGVRPTAKAVPAVAAPEVNPKAPLCQEIERLLGPAAQGRGNRSGSSSSSSSSSSQQELAPAVDAPTLAEAIKAWVRNGTQVYRAPRLSSQMSALLDLFERLRGPAHEVAVRAVGQVVRENSGSSWLKLKELWIATRPAGGPARQETLRLLLEELDKPVPGRPAENLPSWEIFWPDTSNADGGQDCRVLLKYLHERGKADQIDALAQRVIDQANPTQVPALFAQLDACGPCLTPARLRALAGRLLRPDARQPGNETAEHRAERQKCLRQAFAALCGAVPAARRQPEQEAALREAWLGPAGAPDSAQALPWRSCIVGTALTPVVPGQGLAETLEALWPPAAGAGQPATGQAAARADWTPAQREALWSAHVAAHRAAAANPAAAQAFAATLGAHLGALATRSPAECAGLLRRATTELSMDRHPDMLAAFWRALLPQLRQAGLLETAAGADLLSAALSPQPALALHGSRFHPGACLSSLMSAAIEAAPPFPATTAQWLTGICGRMTQGRLAMPSGPPADHLLMSPLLRRGEQDPALPLAAWARGFTEGLAGRDDLASRLAWMMGGIALDVGRIDGARTQALAEALTLGLGDGPDSAALWMGTVLRMAPQLPEARVEHFVQGCAQGLGAAGVAPDVLSAVARAVVVQRAVGPLHDHQSDAVQALREAFGAAAFDAAEAAARIPGDMPRTDPPPPGAALAGSPQERIAALHAQVIGLGPVLTARPAAPAVAPQEREAARLWLALLGESKRITASGLAEAERATLTAALQGALDTLQAYIPAPEAQWSYDRMRGVMAAFQLRDSHGLDAAAWRHDTTVLAWKLGLDCWDQAATDRANQAIRLRAERLLALASPDAAREGLDPILVALVSTAAQSRAQLSHTRHPAIGGALGRLIHSPRPEDAERPARVARLATLLEWIVRAAAQVVDRPHTAALQVAKHLDHPPGPGELGARAWARAPQERRAFFRAIAAGANAGQDPAVRDALLRQILTHRDAQATAQGLADVLGPGEALRDALSFMARQVNSSAEAVHAAVRGLCDRGEATADVLLKTARALPLLDKSTLLAHLWANPAQVEATRGLARHLADPPTVGDARHGGGDPLTRQEVREWAVAYGVASGLHERNARASVASVAQDFQRLPPAAGQQPAPEPAMLAVCQEAVRIAARPGRVLQLPPFELAHAQQRQLLAAVLGLSDPQVIPKTLEFIATAPLPEGATPEAARHSRLHRLEALLMVVRDFGAHLTLTSLPAAHQAMLAQLQALQDSYPRAEPERQAHALVFLRAGECLTGLYHPDVFANASTVGFALRPPGDQATDEAWARHMARLRDGADDLRQVLQQAEAVLAQADRALGAGQARASHDRRVAGFLRSLLPSRTLKAARDGAPTAHAVHAARRDPVSDRDSLMLPLWGRVRPLVGARAQDLRNALALLEPPAPAAPVAIAQEDQGLDEI